MGDEITKLTSSLTDLTTAFGSCDASQTEAKSKTLQDSVLKDLPGASLECDAQSKKWKLLFDSSLNRRMYSNISAAFQRIKNDEGKWIVCWSKDLDSLDESQDLCTDSESYMSWRTGEEYSKKINLERNQLLDQAEGGLESANTLAHEVNALCKSARQIQKSTDDFSGEAYVKESLITAMAFGLGIPTVDGLIHRGIEKKSTEFIKSFNEGQRIGMGETSLCMADGTPYTLMDPSKKWWVEQIVNVGVNTLFFGGFLVWASSKIMGGHELEEGRLPETHTDLCEIPKYNGTRYDEMYEAGDKAARDLYLSQLSDQDLAVLVDQSQGDKKVLEANATQIQKLNKSLETNLLLRQIGYSGVQVLGLMAVFGPGTKIFQGIHQLIWMNPAGRMENRATATGLNRLTQLVGSGTVKACDSKLQGNLEEKLGLKQAVKVEVVAMSSEPVADLTSLPLPVSGSLGAYGVGQAITGFASGMKQGLSVIGDALLSQRVPALAGGMAAENIGNAMMRASQMTFGSSTTIPTTKFTQTVAQALKANPLVKGLVRGTSAAWRLASKPLFVISALDAANTLVNGRHGRMINAMVYDDKIKENARIAAEEGSSALDDACDFVTDTVHDIPILDGLVDWLAGAVNPDLVESNEDELASQAGSAVVHLRRNMKQALKEGFSFKDLIDGLRNPGYLLSSDEMIQVAEYNKLGLDAPFLQGMTDENKNNFVRRMVLTSFQVLARAASQGRDSKYQWKNDRELVHPKEGEDWIKIYFEEEGTLKACTAHDFLNSLGLDADTKQFVEDNMALMEFERRNRMNACEKSRDPNDCNDVNGMEDEGHGNTELQSFCADKPFVQNSPHCKEVKKFETCDLVPNEDVKDAENPKKQNHTPVSFRPSLSANLIGIGSISRF